MNQTTTPQKKPKTYFQTEKKVGAGENNNLLKVSKTKTLLTKANNILPANSASSKTEVVTPNDAINDLDFISDKEKNEKEPKMPFKNDIEIKEINCSDQAGIGSHLDNSNGLNASQNNKMTFQFVSVSPSKKQTIDKTTFKHFKAVQEEELKTWRGLNVKFTQRPGLIDDQIMINGQQVSNNSHLQSSSGATVVYNENGDVTVLNTAGNNSNSKKANNNNFQEE